MGFVFIPLQVVAFATLPPSMRTDATALFSLMRNIGSALGVSVVVAVLTRSTAINHAQIAEAVTPFNRALQSGPAGLMMNPALSFGQTALNGVINTQASIIAYMNAFRFMMLTSVPAILSLLLLQKPKAGAPAGPKPSAHMD